jgi:ribosome biogenesis GTPase / thiamine phosphate phosphatase
MNNTIINLESLGYDEFFESERKKLKLTEYPVARVIAEYKEIYRVKNEGGEYLAKITGKQMFTATKREDYPAVGDWVVIEKLPEEKAIIRGLLFRKTILKKKYSDKQESQIIAANIDVSFITESMDRDYNLNRFERYLVLVAQGNILPIIILNKTDLISDIELKSRIDELKNRFNNIDIISTSTITEHGLVKLRNYITKGKTYCFLGSSGVGKSSLINKLLGKDEIITKEISKTSGKGKHTTTSREMYFLNNGGIVIDNPGTREVGIADSEMSIESVFDEISSLSQNCKFSDCTHTQEPGCAVLKAIEEKELDQDRYVNYIKLKKESDFYKMTDLEKREKDRKFGRFVKNFMKDHN